MDRAYPEWPQYRPPAPCPGLFAAEEERVTQTPVVLVVEDDWILRQALQQELAYAGWAVREVESGETAMDVLQSGALIALLITDIRLGGALDGWAVAEAFRAVHPTLPVLYVSGNSERDVRRVSDSVFLAKPCDPAKLVSICRALLVDPKN